MKTFIFTLGLYHESYNGYDHYDGKIKIEIKARNDKSARNKLKKLAKEYYNGRRWYKIVDVTLEK